MKLILMSLIALAWFVSAPTVKAATVSYDLTIARQSVNITDKALPKITVNGSLPAPVLRFKQGDEAVITVTNHLNVDSAIHWHGLLIPPEMDGVPGFSGFQAIKPNQSFSYRFPIRQTGTYWYHAHAEGQEQDGLYGAFIVEPAGKDIIRVDRDYVVLLSDYAEEDAATILGNLKRSSDYYAKARRTFSDFFSDVAAKGFPKAWQDTLDWGQMRMMRTDLSDVSGYHFLVNGKTSEQNWTGIFNKGERIRLRLINASAMTFYDVRIPGLKLIMVQADGQAIEPLRLDELRLAPAETYDLVVTPTEDKAYSFVAEPIDRSGFALATLAPQQGMRGEEPTQRPRALLTMGDMGGMMGSMDHSAMTVADMQSGWKQAGTPKGQTALDYADMRYAGIQADQREPERTIDIHLGGNMERYIWTINGDKTNQAKPLMLRYGERVRLNFINETMMAHPMHLHGMFMQLDNGQPAAKLPNKTVVTVEPGKSYSVLLTADELGEWAFHCHLLFHMESGMMTKFVVAKLDSLPASQPEDQPDGKGLPYTSHQGHGS